MSDKLYAVVTSQSSTFSSGSNSGIANDGQISTTFSSGLSSLTHSELNPYWEAEIDESTELEELTIYFPNELYPNGLQDFYILTSDQPVFSRNLDENISSDQVQSIHVNSSISNGTSISLLNRYAKFIRIQLAQSSSRQLGLNEVEIQGLIIIGDGGDDPEECGNGLDDDCDGKIDCEDPDCGPIIFAVNGLDPTCPSCEDGEITVSVEYHTLPVDLQYSLDGGVTFVAFNGQDPTSVIHLFDELLEGEYEIVVSNGDCQSEYTIEIKAPRGEHGACFNGGLEDGTSTGWIASAGYMEEDGSIRFNPGGAVLDFFSPRHVIIPTIGSDPNLGDAIPLDDEILGEYVLRLVALSKWQTSGNQAFATTATYCFTVDDLNANFSFLSAVALQEPSDEDEPHDINQRPFFQWKIYDENTGSNVESSPKLFADSNSDYFERQTEFSPNETVIGKLQGLVYSGWTCENIDLSSYIGQTLCIEFLVAGCTLGGHGGYVYIDGLCSSTEDVSPHADLEANSFYCSNQSVDIVALNSQNYDRYSWKVARYINGLPIEFFETERETRFEGDPEFEDILGWYFGAPHNPQTDLQCGDKFLVTLKTNNQCGLDKSFEVEFIYKCEELHVEYPDIYTCITNQDILIQGSSYNQDNNCNSCTYEWSPSEFLYANDISNPTAIQGINYLAADQTYSVTVSDASSGCIETDKVDIFIIGEDPLPFGATTELNGVTYVERCMVKPKILVNFDSPVLPNEITVDVLLTSIDPTISIDYVPFETVLISPSVVGFQHEYEFVLPIEKRGEFEVDIRVYNAFGELLPADANYEDGCVIISRPPELLSFPVNEVYIPNAITPGDDPELHFYPTLGPIFDQDTGDISPDGNSGIYWLRVMIFHRGGGMVFDSGLEPEFAEAPLDSPGWTGREDQFRWDGTDPDTGLNYQPETFTYVVAYRGCVVNQQCIPQNGCNIWNECEFCDEYDLSLLRGTTGTFNIIL